MKTILIIIIILCIIALGKTIQVSFRKKDDNDELGFD